MARDHYIPTLLQLFRHNGYDGTTLSKISEATGLGKASLYHYFPGGKEEMACAVLSALEGWFTDKTLEPLRSPGHLKDRLTTLCQNLYETYEGGDQPCLFTILMTGSAKDMFASKVGKLMVALIEAVAEAFVAAGWDTQAAHHKGEELVIMIQGALILSQTLQDNRPFQRILSALPQKLLEE